MNESMQVGRSVNNRGVVFSQTEMLAHEEWAHFTLKSSAASALVHMLIRLSGGDEAVVTSQRTLAALLNISQSTVSRAIKEAEAARYIEIVRLGATGRGACAYRLNSRVHWTKSRNRHEYFASFRATVLATASDQTDDVLSVRDSGLRRVPVIRHGEIPVPTGDGMEPPSQPGLDGIPPPAVILDDGGGRWEVDARTGEMQKLIGLSEERA